MKFGSRYVKFNTIDENKENTRSWAFIDNKIFSANFLILNE